MLSTVKNVVDISRLFCHYLNFRSFPVDFPTEKLYDEKHHQDLLGMLKMLNYPCEH